MKRSLTIVCSLTLLLALAIGSAFAGDATTSKADAVAKAEASPADRTATMDAMLRTDAVAGMSPMVKMDSHKTKAMIKARVLPPPDGSELALSCKAEVEGFDAGYCLGVVEGVIASMRVCKQDHSAITLGQAADATEKYLAGHPEKLNERDVVLARKALSKAYPCGPFRR
jgi:Rap1a immunity proteins